MSRSLQDTDVFITSSNSYMVSFYRQVRGAESRAPQNNGWDQLREPNDALISPHYHTELVFAALSLDGKGVPWYGEYSISFKDTAVRQRASVFEENGITFNRRHGVGGKTLPPPGYRAQWQHRGGLAAAKLHAHLDANTTLADLPAIMLPRSQVNGETDYIEVHLYAPIAPEAVEAVSGPKPTDPLDILLWKRTKMRLQALGASWNEI